MLRTSHSLRGGVVEQFGDHSSGFMARQRLVVARAEAVAVRPALEISPTTTGARPEPLRANNTLLIAACAATRLSVAVLCWFRFVDRTIGDNVAEGLLVTLICWGLRVPSRFG